MALGYGRVVSNNFGTAKYIVDTNGISTGATHSTIAAALTSASSGETIFIRPGTYTENLTLKAGVNLAAFDCDALTPNVTIIGKCTFTAAGTVSISGIRLQTNSDFFLAVTGSAASNVNLLNCYLNCSNNTGISLTSSGSPNIQVRNCYGNITTTGISLFSVSDGTMQFWDCVIKNPGGATTASSVSGGNLNISRTYSEIAYSCSAGLITAATSTLDCGSINTACITTSGTGSLNTKFTYYRGGTASCIVASSSGTHVAERCIVESSNTNAISGTGTITFSDILFGGTSSLINTTTQSGNYVNLAKYKSTEQPCFLASANLQSNVTGDGTAYTVIYANEIIDQDSNFDGTSTFTAPVTGTYLFTVLFNAGGLTASHTGGGLNLVTSNRSYILGRCNWGAIRNSGNIAGMAYSQICDMDAGDTCTNNYTIQNGTKVVSVTDSSGLAYFAAQLIS